MTGLNVLLRELEPLWHPLSVPPPQAQLRFSLLHLLSQVRVNCEPAYLKLYVFFLSQVVMFVLTMNLPAGM